MKTLRALSSVGRASALQAECRRFDPVSAHHILVFMLGIHTKKTLIAYAITVAAVVQLVRIPACHAGGRGFEPRPLRPFKILIFVCHNSDIV